MSDRLAYFPLWYIIRIKMEDGMDWIRIEAPSAQQALDLSRDKIGKCRAAVVYGCNVSDGTEKKDWQQYDDLPRILGKPDAVLDIVRPIQ